MTTTQSIRSLFLLAFVTSLFSWFETRAQSECGIGAKKLFGENVFVFNLGDKINTRFDEYNPVISPKGDFMLFTARRDSTTGERIDNEDGEFYEDIMISVMENKRFRVSTNLKPENHIFPAQVNTIKHEAPVFITPNDSLLIIFKADKLWYSEKTETGFTNPVEFDKNINFGKYQRHASITADGQRIYFTAEIKSDINGRDNYDLFVSEKDAAGNWGKPKLLPTNINTIYNEDSPEISKDGKTLFFSSDKPDGFGGYDIYQTELVDGQWTDPVNVCKPINSPANDVFFKLSDDGSFAYFSSNRLGGFGGFDIYKVVIDEPKFDHCKPYTLASVGQGVVMAGRDTVTINQRVSIDGSNSSFDGQKPASWYWKNGEHMVSTSSSYSPDYTLPGEYFVSMQIGVIDENTLTIIQKCATKKLVVLTEEEYNSFLNKRSSFPGLNAMVGQDEMLLSLDEGFASNPFDLVPEAENTFINTALDIYVLANDKHPLGSDLKLVSVDKPEFGRVVIKDSNEGVIQFHPEQDFVGIDKFYYSAQDDEGQKAKTFVAVQVLDAKSYLSEQAVRNDKAFTLRDSAIVINVLENDVHPFGYPQNIDHVNRPKFGSVQMMDSLTGTVNYIPKPGFIGNDFFTYTTKDQFGNENTAIVDVTVGGKGESNIKAVEDYKYTQQDKPVAFCVTSNDEMYNNEPLRVAGITQPTHGSIKILNPISGILLYRPRNGFSGMDAFSYSVKDNIGNTAMAAVTVVVAPTQGKQAVAELDEEKVQSGEALAFNVLDNDKLSSSSKLKIATIDEPKNGKLVIKDSLQGIIEYVPNEGFVGVEYFNYTIIDDKGQKSKSIVQIEVVGDNEMQLGLEDDKAETQLNEAVLLKLFENDKHSSSSLTLVSVEQPGHGKVTIIDKARGIVKYVPDFGYGGKDYFTYSAIDADGNKASAKASISVMEPILMADIDTKNLPSLDLKPIYFDFDKAYVRSDARKIMDENIQILKENPDLIIKVLSHCDSRGSRKYNIMLSERRAKSTVKYMTDHGISKERIIAVVGLGESELVNECGDGVYCPNADHQKNRRSDLVIAGRVK